MEGFRLGSIFGFEIRVDLSWFLIFFLVLWTLTVSIFPGEYPQLPNSNYFVMGLVATLLFFASLIAHELSHSLIARAKGIPVEGITLFIFGGISRTRMDAEKPGDEFQIAGIGPLVSLILAGIFWLIYLLSNNAGFSLAVVGVARYLASINLLLAIFNLLPGFPLDGGRLFRSIVWKITGNLKKATRIASWGGKFLGFLLITLGIVQLFGGLVLNGMWLILIGWFLHNAAELSYQNYLVHKTLQGVKANQVMMRSPETISANLTIQELVDKYFMYRPYHAFPVTENQDLVGMITLNQVKNIPREKWSNYTVADGMTSLNDLINVSPDEKMTGVLEKMKDSGLRRVLVTKDGNLLGMITASDVSDWLESQRGLG